MVVISANPKELHRESRSFKRGTITFQNDLDEFVRISVKSDHIVTNHGVNGQEWFRGNGFFSGSLTTIRPKSSRKLHYNQIEGDFAHCTVLDMNNDVLILNEAVTNGESYKIQRYGEVIFLDIDTIATTQSTSRRNVINGYNNRINKVTIDRTGRISTVPGDTNSVFYENIKIPDFGVFGDFQCDSIGYDSLDAAKTMCKYGTNFVYCDLILEYQIGGSKKYLIASTASSIKCSNKSRFEKVVWKGQFLLNQPLGENRCIGPNDRSYKNYSHFKSYETLNLAKIYCQKRYTDCNIIVEVSKGKMYELGKVDPEGCGLIHQTQAEKGVTLRLVYEQFSPE